MPEIKTSLSNGAADRKWRSARSHLAELVSRELESNVSYVRNAVKREALEKNRLCRRKFTKNSSAEKDGITKEDEKKSVEGDRDDLEEEEKLF